MILDRIKPLLFLFCLLPMGTYAAPQMEGGWQGTWDTGMTQFRVAIVFHQIAGDDWAGSFNNIDEGQYDLPFSNLKVSENKVHGELASGEVFDLQWDPFRRSLKGKCLQVHGHFEQPGRFGAVILRQGMEYLLPRSKAGAQVVQYAYRPPDRLFDGWKVEDLRKTQADPAKLFPGLQKIADGTFPHIHSLLVVQNGKLLVDEYFYGYGPKEPHPLQSVTKSVFSMLVGIASGQGMFNPESNLYDSFPGYRSKPGWDRAKDKITFTDLLTMTSGFACDDWKDSKSCSWAMVDSIDWLDFSLSQPLDHKPGEHFAYCGSCLVPLSAALERQSGMKVPRFAQKYLFGPLCILTPVWMEGTQGLTPPAFGLQMTPRDLAKLGLLYLHEGNWEGKPLVPSKWVKESLSSIISADKTHGKGDYGYLWWSREFKVDGKKMLVHFAWGVGGQYLFLVPDLDLVCVVTAGNENDAKFGKNSLKLFEEYVLPAFVLK